MIMLQKPSFKEKNNMQQMYDKQCLTLKLRREVSIDACF